MIFELGFCALTYTATKIYAALTEKPNLKKNKQIHIAQTKQFAVVAKKAAKIHGHHFKVSTISLGLVVFVSNPLVQLFGFAGLAYSLMPMVRTAIYRLVKQKRVSHDFSLSMLMFLCILTQQFIALGMGIIFYHIGKHILAKSEADTQEELAETFWKQPLYVWIAKDDIEIQIALDQLEIGDVVVVGTGEVIPIDGRIKKGYAQVDQYALTGESSLVEKKEGDKVLASAVVISGKIYVLVEKSIKESVISKIGETLRTTGDYRGNIQMKGEKWADWTALPGLGIAGVSYPFLGLKRMTTLINSGCGNQLRLFGCLSSFNYLSVASKHDILIKDGRTLEEIEQVDTILFDKTGTLTLNQPEVSKIFPCENLTEEEVLINAAMAESRSPHPIGKAILKKAAEYNLQVEEIDSSFYEMGYGIKVTRNNHTICVGSVRFIEEVQRIQIPKQIEDFYKTSYEKGYSVILVSKDSAVLGAIEIKPTLRPEAKTLIHNLRKRGLKIYIVSGDHEIPTRNLAEDLEMDGYFAEILSEKKGTIVEQFQEKGQTVCFVGDGINDVIAMKKANISVSLSGATSIALDSAQVNLMNENLSQLETIFQLSDKANKHLKTTVGLTIIPVVINVSGTLFFSFSVLSTIIVNEILSTSIQLINAMRPVMKLENKENAIH